jgi:hypothetical protein
MSLPGPDRAAIAARSGSGWGRGMVVPGRVVALHAALRGKPVRYTGLKRLRGG